MWCVLPAYGAASYVPSIVMERTLYVRERADGLYLPVTYLVAKMADELILATFCSIIFAAATFYAIGFQGSFALFWLVYILQLYIGIALAYFIAAASPNMETANALLPTYVTFCLFFGGFILDFRSMPAYWKWFSYLDFIRYSWGALMVNQFSGDKGDPKFFGNVTVLEHYDLKRACGCTVPKTAPHRLARRLYRQRRAAQRPVHVVRTERQQVGQLRLHVDLLRRCVLPRPRLCARLTPPAHSACSLLLPRVGHAAQQEADRALSRGRGEVRDLTAAAAARYRI